MASPIRPPPPEPSPEVPAPPPSLHPSVDPSHISPDSMPPAPPLPSPAAAAATATPPPPRRTDDSSPPSPPAEVTAPPPPPSLHPSVDPPIPSPATATPPPPRRTDDSSPPSPPKTPPFSTADPSPPLPLASRASVPLPPPAPAPAPTRPPPPAPVSTEARSEQEREKDEAAGGSENATLALALTKVEEAPPPEAAGVVVSPDGSPQKESALTIAKLLSAEELAATEAKTSAEKVAPEVVTGSAPASGRGRGSTVGSKRWLLGGVPEKARGTELKRAELGFRVSAAVFCLVSLSVMSAGTTPGWAGNSFRRYNEYRYTLAASVMGFTYSGFQLVAEVHHLVTGRHIIRAPWREYFNLAMDQILAYLLLSASSAALSRNDVWVSRFGVDQFAKLINASASMAFFAFIALGLSSIISAYHIFSKIS